MEGDHRRRDYRRIRCCVLYARKSDGGTAQQGRATTNARYREEEIPRNIAVKIIQTTPKNESGYMSLKSRCTQSVTSTYVIVCAQEAWAHDDPHKQACTCVLNFLPRFWLGRFLMFFPNAKNKLHPICLNKVGRLVCNPYMIQQVHTRERQSTTMTQISTTILLNTRKHTYFAVGPFSGQVRRPEGGLLPLPSVPRRQQVQTCQNLHMTLQDQKCSGNPVCGDDDSLFHSLYFRA